MRPSQRARHAGRIASAVLKFTGRYIAERLLADGRGVLTFTNHPNRTTPFSHRVRTEPYRFDDPDAMADRLAGVDTLYNTFWIRNPEEGATYDTAVEYSRRLVSAAESAGVRRIVHFSVSNATASDLPYYRAKAAVEGLVADATVDVAGPEVYTFEVLLWHLVQALDVRCTLVHAPPRLAHLAVKGAELLLGDPILTWEEARGLMDELLVTGTPPGGETRFSDWLEANARHLGTDYTSFRERYGR